LHLERGKAETGRHSEANEPSTHGYERKEINGKEKWKSKKLKGVKRIRKGRTLSCTRAAQGKKPRKKGRPPQKLRSDFKIERKVVKTNPIFQSTSAGGEDVTETDGLGESLDP